MRLTSFKKRSEIYIITLSFAKKNLRMRIDQKFKISKSRIMLKFQSFRLRIVTVANRNIKNTPKSEFSIYFKKRFLALEIFETTTNIKCENIFKNIAARKVSTNSAVEHSSTEQNSLNRTKKLKPQLSSQLYSPGIALRATESRR